MTDPTCTCRDVRALLRARLEGVASTCPAHPEPAPDVAHLNSAGIADAMRRALTEDPNQPLDAA